MLEHVFKTDLRSFRQRMLAPDNQYEAVAAKRIGLERPRIDGAGNDTEVGDTSAIRPTISSLKRLPDRR